MSHKTVILFSLWTSVWCAIVNWAYVTFFGHFGVNLIMFICMAIFFGMGCTKKDVPACIGSAMCGLVWGQVDFLLIKLVGMIGINDQTGFIAIVVGTALAMYVHIQILGKTPLGIMPFIFAGVCLTFSQGGGNVAGLAFTLIVGILLAAICGIGMTFGVKEEH